MNIPIDQYIDTLNLMSPAIQQQLHLIRKLDQRVLSLQIKIDEKKESVLEKVTHYEEKKNGKLKAEIELQLNQINEIHKEMIDATKQKIEIAQNVYNTIDEPTEDIDKYLASHPPPQDCLQHPIRKLSRSKRAQTQNQMPEQAAEPHYCYCHRPSFGIMIMCDNPFCEIEWFHTICLEQQSPNNEQKWYCRQCGKNRIKMSSHR